LLRSSNGTLELVDAREFIPRFRARPGITSWLVLDDIAITQREESERAAKRQKKMAEKDNTATNTDEKMEVVENIDSENKTEDVNAVDEDCGSDEGSEGSDDQDADVVDGAGDNDTQKAVPQKHGLELALELGMVKYDSYADVPEKYHKRIRASVFPPTAEEISWMHLGRFTPYNNITV
jgi:hypothetical protein